MKPTAEIALLGPDGSEINASGYRRARLIAGQAYFASGNGSWGKVTGYAVIHGEQRTDATLPSEMLIGPRDMYVYANGALRRIAVRPVPPQRRIAAAPVHQPASCSKSSDEIVDFVLDWSTWLDGDRIASSSWQVPDGIDLYLETADTTSLTVWLGGGQQHTLYQLVNRITTDGGRSSAKTLELQVR